jgi:ASC-1-like (ASCH) protein
MTHALKTWPEYFEAIVSGKKNFEVRKTDRDFAVGETLLLQCFDPEEQRYTGQEYKVRVTYILHGGKFGIEKGFCVMGIEEINEY